MEKGVKPCVPFYFGTKVDNIDVGYTRRCMHAELLTETRLCWVCIDSNSCHVLS